MHSQDAEATALRALLRNVTRARLFVLLGAAFAATAAAGLLAYYLIDVARVVGTGRWSNGASLLVLAAPFAAGGLLGWFLGRTWLRARTRRWIREVAAAHGMRDEDLALAASALDEDIAPPSTRQPRVRVAGSPDDREPGPRGSESALEHQQSETGSADSRRTRSAR